LAAARQAPVASAESNNARRVRSAQSMVGPCSTAASSSRSESGMTINERRDSAEKKACDDARDLNSLARGFMSNEEANSGTMKQTCASPRCAIIRIDILRRSRPRCFAAGTLHDHTPRPMHQDRTCDTGGPSRVHPPRNGRSHARSTDERPVRSHRAAANPIPGRLGQDGGPRQRHQGISLKAAGSRRAHSPKHIDNQWLSNMLNMIGVPICRSRLVLFSGAEIKKVGE
jgi:hypothetical protein